jgi:hypothetical protein
VSSDRLEVWRCPECGTPTYYWHFDDENDVHHVAELPSVPDMSALDAAKRKAIEKDAAA